MNWLLINRILALAGPKSKLAYLVIAPGTIGILQLIKNGSAPSRVNIPVTVALQYGLIFCYGFLVFFYDLFCPDLVKGVKNQKEYTKNKIELVKTMEQLREVTLKHGKGITAERAELLKSDLQQELAIVYEKAKAEEIADLLSKRAYKLSDFMRQLRPESDLDILNSADIDSANNSNRIGLAGCTICVILGLLCALGALSFVVIPVILAFLRASGLAI